MVRTDQFQVCQSTFSTSFTSTASVTSKHVSSLYRNPGTDHPPQKGKTPPLTTMLLGVTLRSAMPSLHSSKAGSFSGPRSGKETDGLGLCLIECVTNCVISDTLLNVHVNCGVFLLISLFLFFVVESYFSFIFHEVRVAPLVGFNPF